MEYKALLKYHTRFQKIEIRDIFYPIAQERLCKARTLEEKTKALLILLLSWNQTYYRFHPFTLRHFFALKNNLHKTKGYFFKLETKNINNINLDAENRKLIRGIYSRFRFLGPTGASKAIHLLNPNLFVMWDDGIRKRYKIYKNNATNYIRFLKTMKCLSNKVVHSYCQEFGCSENKALVEISKKADNRTLAKLIDEYNYVRKPRK